MGKSYVFILMKLPEGVVLSRRMIGPTIYFRLLSDFYSFLQRQKIFNFQSTQEQEGYIEELSRFSQCLNAKTGFVKF